MALILLTGGPGAGKTSLCEELSARGFTTVQESGRAVISRFGQRPQPADFGRAMLELDLANHHQHRTSSVPVFCDRGLPDLAAFATHHRLADVAVYLDAIAQNRYHPSAFTSPPWPEIIQNDSERDQSFAEAVATYGRLVAEYRSNGYDLINYRGRQCSARLQQPLACGHPPHSCRNLGRQGIHSNEQGLGPGSALGFCDECPHFALKCFRIRGITGDLDQRFLTGVITSKEVDFMAFVCLHIVHVQFAA